MRAIPDAIAAQLADGVTTLAHVWRITRRDGAVFCFTDHDRPLLFDAVPCAPQHALHVGVIEKSLGLGVDTASLTGALSADAIDEVEIKRGRWDRARVDLFRVDWNDTDQRVHVFAGHFGEVRRGVSAFEVELRGLQAPLNTPVGRVFSRFCDADLGDSRCGKAIATSEFRGEGVVTAVQDAFSFTASGLGAFADNWFARGRLVWDEGGESEVAVHRSEGGGAIIELLDAPGDVLEVGAAFEIFAGCDKRHETCRVKFENVINFRGFPHMPGNDAMQSGPASGQSHDGGSRWR